MNILIAALMLLLLGSMSVPALAAQWVKASDFGAVCDGGNHPLSDYYGSLGAAQAKYPFVTSLSQQIDYAALKLMSNAALGADGSEHGSAQPELNSPMYIGPGKCYLGSDTWLIRKASGMRLTGAATTSTQLLGDAIVLQFDGLWYSEIANMTIAVNNSSSTVALDIDGNVPGHPYATFGVQADTFPNLLADGGGGAYAVAVCRQGTGGGQCSEMTWINFHGNNASTAIYYQNGFNALDNVFVGGDLQNYSGDGIYLVAGSVKIYGMSFESTAGYAQLAHGGCDIDASSAGADDAIVVDGIRSESLCVYVGAWSQFADLRGITQLPGLTTWESATDYALDTVTEQKGSDSNYHMYRVTSAGTSGSSPPTWPPSGTVTDGSVVWTQTSFNAVEFAEGRLDVHTSRFAKSAGLVLGSGQIVDVTACGSGPSLSASSTRYKGSVTEGSGATGCVIHVPWWNNYPEPICTVSSPAGATLTSYGFSLDENGNWLLTLVNPTAAKFNWLCEQ